MVEGDPKKDWSGIETDRNQIREGWAEVSLVGID